MNKLTSYSLTVCYANLGPALQCHVNISNAPDNNLRQNLIFRQYCKLVES